MGTKHKGLNLRIYEVTSSFSDGTKLRLLPWIKGIKKDTFLFVFFTPLDSSDEDA